MVDELHDVHRSRETRSGDDGIVLTAGLGIDQQQPVGTQAKTREGREEREVHLAYLVFACDVLRGRLTRNRRKAIRRKNDIYRNEYCGYQH